MKKRFKWFVGVVIFVFMFSFSGVTEAISTKKIKDEITCPVCDKTIKSEGSKKDRQKVWISSKTEMIWIWIKQKSL
ncbi:hypothetical protein ACS4QD_04765 [Bacillus amyloliquefaciens]